MTEMVRLIQGVCHQMKKIFLKMVSVKTSDPQTCSAAAVYITPVYQPFFGRMKAKMLNHWTSFICDFSKVLVQACCYNSSKQAAQILDTGKKYIWSDVTVGQFYRFVSHASVVLLIHPGL